MKQLLIFLFLHLTFLGWSQDPVKWNFSYNKEEATAEFTATLEDGWHLYSITTKPDAGPIATSFQFNENDAVKLKGKTKEPEAIEEYDENFESHLKFFEHKVVFTQKVKSSEETSLTGSVTYMVCNATMCLPPVDEHFEIILN